MQLQVQVGVCVRVCVCVGVKQYRIQIAEMDVL